MTDLLEILLTEIGRSLLALGLVALGGSMLSATILAYAVRWTDRYNQRLLVINILALVLIYAGIAQAIAPKVFIERTPTAQCCFRLVFRQIKADTVVVLTYPSDAPITKVCITMRKLATGYDTDRCWVPKDQHSEIQVFEGMTLREHYPIGLIYQDNGRPPVYAYPIPEKVYENGGDWTDEYCGGDDCP